MNNDFINNEIIKNILKNINFHYVTTSKNLINSKNMLFFIKNNNTNVYYQLSDLKLDETSTTIKKEEKSDFIELLYSYLILGNTEYKFFHKYSEIFDYIKNIYSIMLMELDKKNEKEIEDELASNLYTLLDKKPKENKKNELKNIILKQINKLQLNKNNNKEITFNNFKLLCVKAHKETHINKTEIFNFLNIKNKENLIFYDDFFENLKTTFLEFLLMHTKNNPYMTNYKLYKLFGVLVFRCYTACILINVEENEKYNLVNKYQTWYRKNEIEEVDAIIILGTYFLSFFEELYREILEKKEIKNQENKNIGLNLKNTDNSSIFFYELKINNINKDKLIEFINKNNLRYPLRYTKPIDWELPNLNENKLYDLTNNFTGGYSNNKEHKLRPLINTKMHDHKIMLINTKAIDSLNKSQSTPFRIDFDLFEEYKANKYNLLISEEKFDI